MGSYDSAEVTDGVELYLLHFPIAVVLTIRENEKSVRDWKTESEGSVESVMADAIYAIYAKVEEAVRLMCYSHVCR